MRGKKKQSKANSQILDLQKKVESLTEENHRLTEENEQLKADLDNIIKTTVKADDFNSILEQLNVKKEQLQQMLNQSDEQTQLIQKLEEKVKGYEIQNAEKPKTDIEIVSFENSKLQSKIKILESKIEGLIKEKNSLMHENTELQASHQQELLKMSNSIIQPSDSDISELKTQLDERNTENEKLRHEIAALQNVVDNLNKSKSQDSEITNKRSLLVTSSLKMYDNLLNDYSKYKESVTKQIEEYNIIIPKLCEIFNCTSEKVISKAMCSVIANDMLLERDLEISKLKVQNIELEMRLATINKEQQPKLDRAVNEHASKFLNANDLLKIQTILKEKAKNFENNVERILAELVENSQELATDVNTVSTKLLPSFTPTPSPKKSPLSMKSSPRFPLSNISNVVRTSPTVLRPNIADYN